MLGLFMFRERFLKGVKVITIDIKAIWQWFITI